MSSIFFKGKTYIIKLKKPHTKVKGFELFRILNMINVPLTNSHPLHIQQLKEHLI